MTHASHNRSALHNRLACCSDTSHSSHHPILARWLDEGTRRCPATRIKQLSKIKPFKLDQALRRFSSRHSF
jgi:hypothetical protein